MKLTNVFGHCFCHSKFIFGLFWIVSCSCAPVKASSSSKQWLAISHNPWIRQDDWMETHPPLYKHLCLPPLKAALVLHTANNHIIYACIWAGSRAWQKIHLLIYSLSLVFPNFQPIILSNQPLFLKQHHAASAKRNCHDLCFKFNLKLLYFFAYLQCAKHCKVLWQLHVH